jgi:hypothetical protein
VWSSLAQRCNLSCVLRTVQNAESVSGHCTAPVFTGASSNIADLSSLDTLPPFPKCAGSPRLEVLRRLRPLHAVSWHRAYPCTPPRRESACRSGREEFPRSLLSGRQVRHPALPLRHRHGYAVDLHRGLLTLKSKQDQEFPTHHDGEWVCTAYQPTSTGLELALPEEA